MLKSLLSHRYGYRPLPTRIVANEYEILRDEITHIKDLELSFSSMTEKLLDNIFEECYVLDNNEKPPRYRLKFIKKIFPDLNLKVMNTHNACTT